MAFKKIKGTTDFYPKEQRIQDIIFNILKTKAENYGFSHVEPPAIETMELLTAKSGEEIRQQIFPIQKKGKEEIGLRFEFTASIARMFVQRQKALQKPVKWYSFNKAWRYERPQSGREREFFQFNAELLGSSDEMADSEIINLAIDILKGLGLTKDDFFVKLNNRKLLQGLLLEAVTEDKVMQVIRVIDKKEKISREEFKEELKKLGVDDKGLKRINKILKLSWDDLQSFDMNDIARAGYNELKQIMTLVQNGFIKFDISVARGLDYYTGTVFEIFDTNEEFRSLAGGGRYDTMVEIFGGENCPATGFGLGYSTVKLFLEKKGLLPKDTKEIDYFVAIAGEQKEKAFEIATKLREKYSVVIDLMQRSLAKQLKYANQINAKRVVFVGDDEIKTGKFKIKNMESGKEIYEKLENL